MHRAALCGSIRLMKAVVLTAVGHVEVRNVSEPAIVSPRDVLLRMRSVGICGSDIHYYAWGRIGEQVVRYPFRIGHEGSAEVVAIGRDVTTVKPGDRVAVEPGVACGRCDQCRAGRHHTCRNGGFLGCPGQLPGCMAEFIVMPEACCFPIPERMTWDEGALIEPLTIGLYAARRWSDLRGRDIGILGAGPIGLSVLLMAQHLGARRIFVTDRLDYRLAVARGAGAAWTGNPDREDVVAAIQGIAPSQLDAVFECCGQQAAVDHAVDLLAPGGTVFLVGIPETERISFSIDRCRRREVGLQNVRRQNHCTGDTVDLVAAGAVQAGFMVTHRFPLAEAAHAFETVARYRDGVVKAMVDCA